MSFHGVEIYVCIVDFLSCHAMARPGSYSVTWKFALCVYSGYANWDILQYLTTETVYKFTLGLIVSDHVKKR